VGFLGSVAKRPIHGVGGEEVVCPGKDAYGNGVNSPDLIQDEPNV